MVGCVGHTSVLFTAQNLDPIDGNPARKLQQCFATEEGAQNRFSFTAQGCSVLHSFHAAIIRIRAIKHIHKCSSYIPVQENESTPERLDSMPDAPPAETGTESLAAPHQLAQSIPEAAPAGDLRQQLEARRRARAGQ